MLKTAFLLWYKFGAVDPDYLAINYDCLQPGYYAIVDYKRRAGCSFVDFMPITWS